MIVSLTQNAVVSILAIMALLLFSQIFAFILSIVRKDKDFSNLKIRLKSWWMIILFILCILGFKNPINYIFVGIMCFLAMKEFFSFIEVKDCDKPLVKYAFWSIPVEMYLLSINWVVMFYLFVPLYMFLFIPIRRVLSGQTEDFIKTTGTIQWGMALTLYSLGYVGAFLLLPFNGASINGAELLLYLLILNSLNDGFQYIWGKLFGKNKIVPSISPNKTWEGFIGGTLTTVFLSVIVSPYLTPFGTKMAVAAGLIISVFGFLGDVVMSAVKRDAGVKDSSNLIPGHGGILDRVDSLIFTAPLFFHFVCYFCK